MRPHFIFFVFCLGLYFLYMFYGTPCTTCGLSQEGFSGRFYSWRVKRLRQEWNSRWRYFRQLPVVSFLSKPLL